MTGPVDVRPWAPLKVGGGVGCYVVHNGQDNVSAHYRRDDGCYCILEFGACRSDAQRFADRLNAAGHTGQTVPAAFADVGGAA